MTNVMPDLCIAQPGPSGPVVIRDTAMLGLVRRIEQVAPSKATVLVTGESGTGKEWVATHLHQCSGRHDHPFIAINCAAIPDALLETELFGHEQGAFPGAMARHVGRFEAATGGTLLLDEIGEMDLRVQAKVLRVLQERKIDRLGGSRPVPVDVRIIATTNRNLVEEVQAGRFRADLFYRLNVITLKVPPLRDRLADIPALAQMFAQHFAGVNGLDTPAISGDAMEILLGYAWPGNVRELENVMHRAVLTEVAAGISAATLEIDALEIDPLDAARGESLAGALAGARVAIHTSGRTIEAVEKDMILDALCQSKGNRMQTAAVLGISIRTLRNKLHEYERDGTRIPRPVIIAVA